MAITKNQKHQRARNLDDKGIGEVLSVLDGWAGKLTWESLIAEVELRTRQHYTRQALSAHERVQQAFAVRKKALAAAAGEPGGARATSAEQTLEQQVIARLEAQVQRLTAENNALLEKFTMWAYNARTRGLDEAFLSQPLAKVHRQQTK